MVAPLVPPQLEHGELPTETTPPVPPQLEHGELLAETTLPVPKPEATSAT